MRRIITGSKMESKRPFCVSRRFEKGGEQMEFDYFYGTALSVDIGNRLKGRNTLTNRVILSKL